MDFGTSARIGKMEMNGDANAVGTWRMIQKGKNTSIVERQVFREIREDMMAHSYNIESIRSEEHTSELQSQ